MRSATGSVPPRPDLPPVALPGVVQEDNPPATWGILEMIPVFLSAYGLATVVAVLVDQFVRPRSEPFIIIVGLVQELAFAGAVLFWIRYVGRGPMAALGLRPRRPWGDVGAGVLGGVAMLILQSTIVGVMIAIITAILGHQPGLPRAVPEHLHGAGVWLFGVILVIAAPVGEEVFFRGFLFKGLRRRFEVWPAALISGLAFSLFHLRPIAIPSLFAAGVLLALLYENRQSLLASMTAHATNNLIIFLVVAARAKLL
jgi:membrane protease YdiL (CAAX protease family)